MNYLANWLWVLLVLESMDPEEGRIVLVSSWSHDARDPRNEIFNKTEEQKRMWKDPQDLAYEKVTDPKNDMYGSGYRRYGASKTLLVMFM